MAIYRLGRWPSSWLANSTPVKSVCCSRLNGHSGWPWPNCSNLISRGRRCHRGSGPTGGASTCIFTHTNQAMAARKNKTFLHPQHSRGKSTALQLFYLTCNHSLTAPVELSTCYITKDTTGGRDRQYECDCRKRWKKHGDGYKCFQQRKYQFPLSTADKR